MAEPELIIALRTAGCGCEGLMCWACMTPFKKGDRYILAGSTHLCITCTGYAIATWIRVLKQPASLSTLAQLQDKAMELRKAKERAAERESIRADVARIRQNG